MAAPRFCKFVRRFHQDVQRCQGGFSTTVGELRSGVTGFATIYATGSHRFLVQLHAENLSHKNNYSNLANKRARI